MKDCQICKKNSVKVLLDCGHQPLCNRFIMNPTTEKYTHPLVLGQCEMCGLIQITDPVPNKEIASQFEWLKYNEPEQHLDNLADIISNLTDISQNPVAFGISVKDDSLLHRLQNRKFSKVWRIDPKEDLGITRRGVWTETILPYLTSDTTLKMAAKYGRADVVIARHVYEHAPHTHTLLNALKNLVKPNGYVVFEIPDCTKSLEFKDYSMLWEEHLLYFSPDTFRNSFGFTDFSLARYECFSYPVENALVAITQLVEKNTSSPLKSDTLKLELERGNSYGKGLSEYGGKLRRYLKTYKSAKGKVAVFGAGHTACMYINLMKIKDYVEYVLDDNPDKKGLYMPGSLLAICGSNMLIDDNIGLCLLTLNPESETKVVQNNKLFLEKGGIFASIYPGSKYAINELFDYS